MNTAARGMLPRAAVRSLRPAVLPRYGVEP